MTPNTEKTGVLFGVQCDVSRDLEAKGTMTKAGATCPCCDAVNTMEDIRLEGCAHRIGAVMVAVVSEGADSKLYRTPTSSDLSASEPSDAELAHVFSTIPGGLPDEPINTGSIKKGGVSITRWGINSWQEVFSKRQLFALGTLSTLHNWPNRKLKRPVIPRLVRSNHGDPGLCFQQNS